MLYEWGTRNLLIWLGKFQEWKKSQSKREIKEILRSTPSARGLTAPEEEALIDLLDDVFLGLGNNDDAKTNAINSTTAAWIHEPTRKLTQSLWKDVLKKENSKPEIFVGLVKKLRESMVPEAMGLAVTMAQRIGAITSLSKIISSEKTETNLQRLIENFPWLLGPELDKLTANQTIKTLVEEKYILNASIDSPLLSKKDESRKPDFVFLSDVGVESEIVVFELKGPEHSKTIQRDEVFQLRDYLDIISGFYNNEIKIRGFIVVHETGKFEADDKRITALRWSAVLASARKRHVSFLASLLQASEPKTNDKRIEQISDFGGVETLELLKRLNIIVEFDGEIQKYISIN